MDNTTRTQHNLSVIGKQFNFKIQTKPQHINLLVASKLNEIRQTYKRFSFAQGVVRILLTDHVSEITQHIEASVVPL
ncbi:hypothetical protein J6590_015007 [Homalodisca vitripennis]|nr:hypothetical protein J6590_015007 [Homalodisca vitripennis]